MDAIYQYKETAEFEAGFAEYYEKYILPLNSPLDSERNEIESNDPTNKLLVIVISILSVIGWVYCLQFVDTRKGASLCFALFGGIAYGMWWLLLGKSRKNYFTGAKTQVLPLLLKFFGNFSYDTKGEINSDVIKNHFIFMNGYSCNFNDYIKGSYKGVDIEIGQTVGSSRSALVIYLDKIFSFDGSIIVKPCDAAFSSTEENEMKTYAKLISYKTNNEQFDFQFKTYASSTNFAEKFLTPDFQNKLLGLDTIFSGNGLRFSLMNDKILVAIPTSDYLFKSQETDTPYTSADNIKRILYEIKSVFSVIDGLLACMDDSTLLRYKHKVL